MEGAPLGDRRRSPPSAESTACPWTWAPPRRMRASRGPSRAPRPSLAPARRCSALLAHSLGFTLITKGGSTSCGVQQLKCEAL
eukprot:5122031-Pyramimonas_sp.AAC.2